MKFELIPKDTLDEASNIMSIAKKKLNDLGEDDIASQLSKIHRLIYQNRFPCNVKPAGEI